MTQPQFQTQTQNMFLNHQINNGVSKYGRKLHYQKSTETKKPMTTSSATNRNNLDKFCPIPFPSLHFAHTNESPASIYKISRLGMGFHIPNLSLPIKK